MRTFSFNPLATPGGSTINTQIPGGSHLRCIIKNASPANLAFVFSNGFNVTCDSQDRRLFEIHNLPNGNINWTINSYVSSANTGNSLVEVEVYEAWETIVEQYPSPVSPSAPPNLQFFQDARSGNVASNITIPLKAGQLFYLTRIEYNSDIASILATIHVNAANGDFLPLGTARTLQWLISEKTSDVTEFIYVFPAPFVQELSNVAMTITSSVSGTTPAHTLVAWGYYV